MQHAYEHQMQHPGYILLLLELWCVNSSWTAWGQGWIVVWVAGPLHQPAITLSQWGVQQHQHSYAQCPPPYLAGQVRRVRLPQRMHWLPELQW